MGWIDRITKSLPRSNSLQYSVPYIDGGAMKSKKDAQ